MAKIMNERIKELAEQAGFYVADDKIYTPTISEDITICQTKFAELIILDCADIAAEDSETVGDRIKQYFGVE